MRERILELMNENENLPPLPDILFKLNDLISRDDIHFQDVSKLIEIEPVIAGRVMKWANSALYGGGRQEIKTLNLAVGRLGLNLVQDLVYSFLIPRLFVNAKILNHRWFWKHSLAVAVFSKALANLMRLSTEEVGYAYIAGLIHDIGILIFATLIPKEYGLFLLNVKELKEPLDYLEQKEYGISHPELGGIFAEKWWLIDKEVIDVVNLHHRSFNDIDENQIAKIVNLANTICVMKRLHNGLNVHAAIMKENQLESMGFNNDDFETILQTVNDSITEADELMSMSL